MGTVVTRRALMVGGALVAASGASACKDVLFRERIHEVLDRAASELFDSFRAS